MVESLEWFFAKVGPDDTEFIQDYARQDYTVMAFAIEGEEGQCDGLELTVRNPRAPLLSGGIWLWVSYSVDGAPAEPIFFGRLVAIPRTLFQEKITIEYDARPPDFVSQKTELADTLKVLPNYDEVFIDEQKRDDLDAVLEAYPLVWHIDRVTHELSTTEVLIGEDGVIELAPTDILYEGFELDFNQIPLTSVEVAGTFNWDQIAAGGVDITQHILDNWPNGGVGVGVAPRTVVSYTLSANDWPKVGARLQDGWVAVEGTECIEVYSLEVRSNTSSKQMTFDWGNWTDISGATGTVTTNISISQQYLDDGDPPGSIGMPLVLTENSFDVKYTRPDPTDPGPQRIASINSSQKATSSLVPLHHLRPKLVVGFDAARPRKETIRFNMIADVQPIVTLPGDDERLKIELNSVKLNDPLDPGDDTDQTLLPPIRDARRRSYAVTSRGEQSIKYLLALARANLLKRSRVVQITERLTRDAALELIPQISMRKNVELPDPRLPGDAVGKIIGYRFAVDGNAGTLDCTVTVGCAIGRGGEVTTVEGTPTYAEADVMGPDVQVFTGRTVLFDSSVGYSPAMFMPNDDGLDFLSTLTVDDLIEEALTVENPASVQLGLLEPALDALRRGVALPDEELQEKADTYLEYRAAVAEKIMEDNPTRARLRLKPMKKLFESDQEIPVTELKIPTQINLEGTA